MSAATCAYSAAAAAAPPPEDDEGLEGSDSDGDHYAGPTSVFSWGKGEHGQLGHVGFETVGLQNEYVEERPRELSILASLGVSDLSCGNEHSAAVTRNGEVLTWGRGTKHRLGHGSEDGEQGPRLVEALAGEDVVSVECGDAFTACLTEDGKVFTWGHGGSMMDGAGALGHGDNADCVYPKELKFFTGANVVQIAAGKGHMLALDDRGQVYSWGKGDYGRLGNGGSRSQDTPETVELFEEIPCKFIAAGEHFSGAISDEGQVWMWGRNDQQQLGLGGGLSMEMYSMEDYPTLLADNSAENDVHELEATYLSLGHQVAAAVYADQDGDTHVFSWGGKMWIEPQRMSLLGPENVWMVACGHNFTSAVGEDGGLFTWSRSGFGGWQKALGHDGNRAQPHLVDALGRSVVGVACGKNHMLAMSVDFEAAEE